MASRDTTTNDLLDLLAGLQAKEDQTRERLVAIEADKAAVQTTLRLYREQHQPSLDSEQHRLFPSYVLPDIKGMTQKKAVETITQANGGELRLSEARKHMLASGFFRGSNNPRRNSGPQLRALVIREGDYERVGPGVFRKIQPNYSRNGPRA